MNNGFIFVWRSFSRARYYRWVFLPNAPYQVIHPSFSGWAPSSARNPRFPGKPLITWTWLQGRSLCHGAAWYLGAPGRGGWELLRIWWVLVGAGWSRAEGDGPKPGVVDFCYLEVMAGLSEAVSSGLEAPP